MTSALVELLVELHRAGVRLTPHRDRIRATPSASVTDELADRIRQHKPNILAGLITAGDVQCFGTVNAGWTRGAWRTRLRQLAGRCEVNRPDRCQFLRAWADAPGGESRLFADTTKGAA